MSQLPIQRFEEYKNSRMRLHVNHSGGVQDVLVPRAKPPACGRVSLAHGYSIGYIHR